MSDPSKNPAGERTQPIETRLPDNPVDPAEAGADGDTRADATAFGAEAPENPAGPIKAYGASSSELATSSRRSRRRQRDRKAEWRAVQVLIGLFVGVGGALLVAVNVLLDDPPAATDKTPAATSGAAGPAAPQTNPVPPPPDEGVISGTFVETVDLPALRQLRNEGLTIAAEGLPAVDSSATGPGVGPLAGRETCRFAYGVWEFSPNRRFRFMPTCPSMDGQVLFGAYAVQGGVIRMSPLKVSGVELLTEFFVEKPSRLVTRVTVGGGRVTMTVRQRVTVIRAGQFGDSFFDTYAPRNTLAVAKGSTRRPPVGEPKAPPPKRDPLLDLLRGGGQKR